MNFNKLEKLSEVYGDSYYLLDSKKFEDNFECLLDAFNSIYSNTKIGYSYKTNYIPKLCKIIDIKGGYAEVVSDMEYDLAIKLGVEPERIIVNGPYKPKNILEKFLLNKSIVNLDSFVEIEYLKEIALKNPTNMIEFGIRCNFDIHNNVVSRFGIDINNPDLLKKLKEISEIKNVKFVGIHCHYPDRNADSYSVRAKKIIEVASSLFTTPPKYIDIGGGFFGKMDERLKKQFSSYHDYKEYANNIATEFKRAYSALPKEEQPILFLEPGSALVADTMKFVCRVIDIKNIRGTNIAMTSGSKFNIGLLSSTVNMPLDVHSKYINDKVNEYDISGFTCIESDYLFKGYTGCLFQGDFLIFNNVGSYSIVFKPPFILPNVPIIELTGNSVELIKRQETVDDIFETFIW
ncbi:Orn/DAP/Arg decarboxylase, family 2 [Photobacterium angustum S14]|uniref:Orn/DAP/Arg decarboxylase, family 2 n=2 Tax=Photobacterium TaxID=657 RepID=Q1ZRK8_PHOAS|nr:decarboxylase [Photobacterium angustum]EAS65319.1 Orn/DAP/Arg decarboxylase, family 2 [Photobacterium angustum S14]